MFQTGNRLVLILLLASDATLLKGNQNFPPELNRGLCTEYSTAYMEVDISYADRGMYVHTLHTLT